MYQRKAQVTKEGNQIIAAILTSDIYGSNGPSSVKFSSPSPITVAAKLTWEVSGVGPEDIGVLNIHDPYPKRVGYRV